MVLLVLCIALRMHTTSTAGTTANAATATASAAAKDAHPVSDGVLSSDAAVVSRCLAGMSKGLYTML